MTGQFLSGNPNPEGIQLMGKEPAKTPIQDMAREGRWTRALPPP